MLDPLLNQLDSYMTLLSRRQKIVASNIANADTPGYAAKDLDFEAELRAASSSSSSSSPAVKEVPGLRVKNDGNNVDLDREARLLAENALRFSMASNLVRGELKDMHLAIQGGGGAA